MEIIVIILVVAGLIGAVIPILPGPILSFAGVTVLFFSGTAEVSLLSFIIFLVAGMLIAVLDYVAPILGAKFFGATRQGIIGAVVGAIIGFFLFPPLGIVLGAFLGAILGEVSVGKTGLQAIKAALGTLLGSGSVLVLQVVYALIVLIWVLFKIF